MQNDEDYESQIKLYENEKLFQNDDLIVKELNEFFKNVVSTLNTKEIFLSAARLPVI